MPQVPQRNGLRDRPAPSDCPAYATNYFRLLHLPSDEKLHAYITDGRCLCRRLRSRSEANSGNYIGLVNDGPSRALVGCNRIVSLSACYGPTTKAAGEDSL